MILLALYIAAFLFLCWIGIYLIAFIKILLEEFLAEILILGGVACGAMYLISIGLK